MHSVRCEDAVYRDRWRGEALLYKILCHALTTIIIYVKDKCKPKIIASKEGCLRFPACLYSGYARYIF